MKKFTNVRLKGEKEPVSILVEDGKITKIAKEIPQECETIDVGGNLVIPPYVDPHLHLDYVFTADMGEQNGSGTLFEGIQRWSESKGNMTVEQMRHAFTVESAKRCFMVCRQSVHILMSQIRLLPD